MVKKIKKLFGKINIGRTTVLIAAFVVMTFVLLHRLFTLQIIEGQEYADNFSLRTTKERTLKSTRGNILDRNGNILASNELSYSVTLEDNGTYTGPRQRNLSLNGEVYKIINLIEENGNEVDQEFHISIDENGEYVFDVKDFALDRFRADIYGHKLIDDLKEDQKNTSASQIINYLSTERFGLIITEKDKLYKDEELELYGLPNKYTNEELLKMVTVRYALAATSYKKYVPVIIASNVGEQTVAAVMENQELLTGIDIQEDSARIYTEGVYFSSILGYTGKASAEELEVLKEKRSDYLTSAIIGKTGIEEYMETELQGKDGKETLYVDNVGKVLQIDKDSRTEPVQGNNVYLTIDSELNKAAYKILEQRIAGILVRNIEPIKRVEKPGQSDASAIPIPIYDVYNALIRNSVIDISHFEAEADTSETERIIYAKFKDKQEQIFAAITQELTGDNPAAYKDLSEEMQTYIHYIIKDLLMDKTNILSETSIDKSDPTYIEWTKNQSISLQEYLTYAASKNWIDMSSVLEEKTYLNAKEAYQSLSAYIADYLKTDTPFSKLLYKYLIMDDQISGAQLCTILYDQNVLRKEDEDYNAFISGDMSSYDLMVGKIRKLEITPAQLALDPCSGSVVVVDPNNGEILACVTYPGYDNNRLANQMDVGYYRQLTNDLSEPFYNKATQQKTAPGSTFKLVTALAGITEGVVDDNSTITCLGSFERIPASKLSCWNHDGHGVVYGIRGGIEHSCNVFFSEVAYRMGLNESNEFSDTESIRQLRTYAERFDLDKNSGIEISEASPQISDALPIPSSIGQGTHNFTTSQLARYAATLANSGTSYNISLLNKTTDSNGNLIEDYTPRIESKLEVDDNIWEDIHVGMRGVITETNKDHFEDLEVTLAGKTGTAEQIKTRANHGLFIGYAPYEQPEISMAVRIAYGYTSTNAALVAKDICNYYFDLKPEDELITGVAADQGTSGGGALTQTD